ncbi:uncharacterized protein LOC119722992 [Patiria miniata]|uniref:Uncharacterized protein n=1 Tax=Patiria miniata TaxID=46514 RepID=A0A913ZC70_PATMI|nr:uncharacterized protein LOC119722992 [Patiria miniata]
MLHQWWKLLALALSCWVSAWASSPQISGDSFLFVQKHPQEFFCEADFVLVGKVLRKTTSNVSLRNFHHVTRITELRPSPTETNVLLVRVKRVFKGRSYAKEGNTVALVTSRIKTDLKVVLRRSYVFTGFVRIANVPDDYGHCSSLLHTGRHVFVENQLNFMWGCSWFKPRPLLTSEQKQGLSGMYAKGCDCQIVRCHGRTDDPRRYCFGDLQGALFGEGCVMHHGNEQLTVPLMTCSRRSGGYNDTCKWITCSAARHSRPEGKFSAVGAGIKPPVATSSPNATCGDLC